MKFSPNKKNLFDRGDVKGFAYNTKEEFPDISCAFFTLNGKHPEMKSLNSDRLYYILKGDGTFIINNKTITAKEKDVVIIPKNTPYNYHGEMECFLVHAPAFNREQEIRLNKESL